MVFFLDFYDDFRIDFFYPFPEKEPVFPPLTRGFGVKSPFPELTPSTSQLGKQLSGTEKLYCPSAAVPSRRAHHNSGRLEPPSIGHIKVLYFQYLPFCHPFFISLSKAIRYSFISQKNIHSDVTEVVFWISD
jgi:hypothetical protein